MKAAAIEFLLKPFDDQELLGQLMLQSRKIAKRG